jgi:hypothetical protein
MLNKIRAGVRFFFRKRLFISSNFVQAKIKDFQYKISPQAIINYNQIVSNKEDKTSGEKNYIHPLFFAKINWQVIDNLNNYLEKPISQDVLNTLVHQSEQVFIHNWPEAINEFLVKSEVIEIKEHKRGTKLAIKFDYFAGETHVATEYSSAIMFGIKLQGEGQCVEQMPWPKAIKQAPLWIETIAIDKKLPYTYADQAEIDAPIHTNPTYAKSIGLPDIILQGTCTFAKSISRIVAKELDNDYSRLKGVSARFTGHVVPPNRLNVKLLKKTNKSLSFEVTNDRDEVVIKGGEILF